MKPFGRRIQIRPADQKTLIQTADSQKIMKGEILLVGPDVKTFMKPGDEILFTPWGVDEVDVNGEKFYFLIESDEFILALENKPMPSGLASQLQY